MRLGEIKQIIFKVVDNDTFQLDINKFVENKFNGNLIQINNFNNLKKALLVINNQTWNNFNQDIALFLIGDSHNRFNQESDHIQIDSAEYQKLMVYITSLNTLLPFFCSILLSMVREQDEYTINVKLPTSVTSPADLQKFDKSIKDILTKTTIEGGFQFKGFDTGTDWLMFAPTAVSTYYSIIGCLDIAKKYFEMKKSYFESEAAAGNYKLAKLQFEVATGKSSNEGEIEKYIEAVLSRSNEEKVEELLSKLNYRKDDRGEVQVKLLQAVNDIVNSLGEGTEFHLSLNPPAGVEEIHGSLVIDYTNIQKLNAPNMETKQLTDNAENGNLEIAS